MTADRTLKDDCFRTDQPLLSHDAALAIIAEAALPIVATEMVATDRCHGRVLAEPIVAPRDVPLTDNSAVDGYAFAHAGYLDRGFRLEVAGRIAAGHPAETALAPGTAARIFTGAPMPAGADTVAMQEDCDVEDGEDRPFVTLPADLKPGANRRLAGEDVRAGSVLIDAGTRLRPQDVGAIASAGRDSVACFQPLKVAIVSSGDEIVRPGQPIAPGQVYDANYYLLAALLQTLDVTVTDVGILPDSVAAVRSVLSAVAENHDVVITSGGASMGEEDHIADAIAALGERHLWRLAIKPGRPLGFGRIGRAVVLGLPGNPVAAMVSFLLYGRPLLIALGGGGWRVPHRYLLPADFTMTKKPGRREFLRGILASGPAGGAILRKYPRDGSGIVTSLREADGLIELPEDLTRVDAGDPVAFLPFPELGIAPR